MVTKFAPQSCDCGANQFFTNNKISIYNSLDYNVMQIQTDIDLSPNLQKYLPRLDESFMYYNEHGIKHPSPLYNVSLSKIEDSLQAFLEVLSKYNNQDFEKVDKEFNGQLLKMYKDFLYACREHLDDCFNIIKIFIKPPQDIKKERVQFRWLQLNAREQTKDIFREIDEYKKYLDNSVNELKHNNALMAGIAFFDSQNGSNNCLGYFIGNVINGAYAPVEKIHPKLQDKYTGFSFRRDLHYNLFNIFRLSEVILDFLREKIGININAIDIKTNAAPEKKKEMFRKVMEISRIHFPDEYLKSVPSVVLNEKKCLKLEYPSQLSIKPNRLDRVVITLPGDGHTREFKMLYM